MKYYIGSTNGSGIEANSFEDFVAYLKDMADTAEKQGDEYFEVNVENYLTDEAPDNDKCPMGGDASHDCADCVYAGEYHLVNGECIFREEARKLSNRELRDLYYGSSGRCCKCGTYLTDKNNMIGSVFVLDKCGNFYCMNCDKEFEDGDERIFEPEFCEEEGRELAKRIISEETDMYNPITGVYAFHYNDNDAICTYKFPPEKAIMLAKEAERLDEYWSALLGTGGLVFDNPEDFVQAYGVEDGWMTCEEFLEANNKEA